MLRANLRACEIRVGSAFRTADFVREECRAERAITDHGTALTAHVDRSVSYESSGWSCALARTLSAIVAKLREGAARCETARIIDAPPEWIANAYSGGIIPLDSSIQGLSSDAVESLRRSRESACGRRFGNVVRETSCVDDSNRVESTCERAQRVSTYARVAPLVGYCVVRSACQLSRLFRCAELLITDIDVLWALN